MGMGRRLVRGSLAAGIAGATVGALVAASAASPGPAAPGRAQPGLPTACEAPFAPSWAGVGEWADLDVPWSGDRLDFVPPLLDTDDDGTADSVEQLPAGLQITRGSGVVQIAGVTLTNGDAPADVDSDGRSDLVVSPTDDATRSFVVLGSLPDGSYETVASIGVAVSDQLVGGRNVGDHDGDGTDDLVFSDLGSTTGYQEIHSGAALAAPGPGGTYAAAPIDGFGGSLQGGVAFTPERSDLLTSAAAPFAFAPATDVDLILHGNPEVEMVVPADGAVPWPDGVRSERDTAGAYSDGERTWIVWSVVGLDDVRRTWAWELTDLCPLPPPATTVPSTTSTPTAPAAQPVSAVAAFTG